MSKNENFIEKARKIHENKYDYSKVEYVNTRTKVCIICPEHGEFWQTPDAHLYQKSGCPKCGNKNNKYNRKKSEESKNRFCGMASEIHNGKYDYSKTEYENNKKPVCIICPEHGEFWQRPDHHLFQKRGCPYCGGTKKLTTDEFIKRSKEIFGEKYDYSKTEYVNDRSSVCLIEKETNKEIWQNAKSHLSGCGHISNSPRKKLTTDEFVEKAKKIHGNEYDYSKSRYVNNETKVCIICKKHGEFWQTPHIHCRGDGCPICKLSKLEKEIMAFLEMNKIKYETHKKFKWLKHKHKMHVDFFIPEKNIVIECQGKQHFSKVPFFGGDENYFSLVERDKLKKKLCNEHGIKVIYYSDCHKPYWDKVFYDKFELLLEINKLGEKNEF